MTIGRLQKVLLRDVWKHEAHDFSGWLADNLDFVGEALNMDLTLVEQEASAGPFSVDILAEDVHGNLVIIENQLERTDHDHLGKLITYLSNRQAKTAIWISSDPRPEHEAAVHWLNETTPADVAFYLVKAEAFRIDDSPPAPLLTVVAGPTTVAKQISAQKTELAERHVLRLEFWGQLLDKAKSRTPLHADKSPAIGPWLGASAGLNGLFYAYAIRRDNARIELYIDQGDHEDNKRAFDTLYAHKDQIEKAFQHPLDWQRSDNQRSCRIRYLVSHRGLADQEHWPHLQEQMIDAMVQLSQAFQAEIQGLKHTD